MSFLTRAFKKNKTTAPQRVQIRVAQTGTLVAEALLGQGVFAHESSYYFDRAQVRMDLLTENDRSDSCTYQGKVRWYDVQDGDVKLETVCYFYADPKPGYHHLLDKIGFHAGEFGGLSVTVV